MYVLGLIGLGENPGACIVRDGQLVALGEEERFTRLKGSHGMFPSRAVAWRMQFAACALGDIDRIAFAWDAHEYPWTVGRHLARTFLAHRQRAARAWRREPGAPPYDVASELLLRWPVAVVRRGIGDGLRAAGLRGDMPPIEFVPHHLAHAYSAYAMSGFDRAGILTIDGSGERVTTQLAVGEPTGVRVVDAHAIPDSLGWFYAAMTQYLGFVPSRDEGKLMGLAALGEARSASNRWVEPLSRFLTIEAGSYRVDPIYSFLGGHHDGDRFTDALTEMLTAVDPEATPVAYGEQVTVDGQQRPRYLQDRYVDIAWASQTLLEQAAVMLAERLVREHGVSDLCLAGGVALNCKMNGELLRRSGARRIFVQPAANDTGSALGAALYVSERLGADIRRRLRHVYYGPGFDDDEIRGALDVVRVSYQTVDDPAAEAARLLGEGRIIAWFQGRMEFGSRALGGRSILANPVAEGIRDRVNREVKFRESWRPFCPSLTSGDESTYLVDPGEAAFMIVAYEATEACRQHLEPIVHVDGTVRPQVVEPDTNPLFHSLIRGVERETGHPVVLNTSFNVRGEPIICTPPEAIRGFYSTGLEALIIGHHVLTK